jgi:hypothetical protein
VGKGRLWKSGAGAVVLLLFLAAKISWKFSEIWIHLNSDVSDSLTSSAPVRAYGGSVAMWTHLAGWPLFLFFEVNSI